MQKRKELLDLLNQCTNKQQAFFKRMYSHNNLDISIEEIVLKMETQQILNGIRQAKASILKNQDKIELKLNKLKNNILKNEN